MAIAVALPLCGLDPNEFTNLRNMLQGELPSNSGQQSLSSSSSSSNNSSAANVVNVINGIDEINRIKEISQINQVDAINGINGANESTRDENTPPSNTQPSSSGSVMSEHQYRRQRNTRESPQPRIMYQGRDILNLAANIRDPVWITRDTSVDEFESVPPVRSMFQRLHGNTPTEDQTTEPCPYCDFQLPKPNLS